MKPLTCCLVAAALASGARAEEAKPEELAKQLFDSASKIVRILEGIKDVAGAEKAKAELERTFADIRKSEEAFRKLSGETRKMLEESYRPKFEELRESFLREAARLRKDEKVARVLDDVGPFKVMRDQREAAARVKALTIEKALQAYRVQHQEYPAKLEDLARGERPFLEASAIKDPWGKDFKFDPAGPKNKGAKPDVWTVTPEGKAIGNWEDPPPPPKDRKG